MYPAPPLRPSAGGPGSHKDSGGPGGPGAAPHDAPLWAAQPFQTGRPLTSAGGIGNSR